MAPLLAAAPIAACLAFVRTWSGQQATEPDETEVKMRAMQREIGNGGFLSAQ